MNLGDGAHDVCTAGQLAAPWHGGTLSTNPLAPEAPAALYFVALADSLPSALVGLEHLGVVDTREAFRESPDRDRLLAGLKREGIDTSVVERLA